MPATGLRIEWLRTIPAVERVREVWLRLQTHPDADIDYFLALLRICRNTIGPLVMAVYRDERCVCLVAGRIQETAFEASSGNRVFWRARVRRLAIFYDAFMGNPDEATMATMIERLLEMLPIERIDMVVWDGVHWASKLRRLLQCKPAFWCRDWLVRPKTHWRLLLPDSLETIFQTQLDKKRRYWARRTIRLLETDYAGRLRYVEFTSPHDLDKLFCDARAIAQHTRQWQQGVGFCDSEEQRDRIKLFAEKGALRALVLYLDDQPVSFWICTRFGRDLYLDFTGYDPAFRRYEPGTVALYRVLDHACREDLRFVDMGSGNYEYMRKHSNAQFRECTLLVFASNLRGILLNTGLILTLGPIELIRRGAQFCRAEARLKQLWARDPNLRRTGVHNRGTSGKRVVKVSARSSWVLSSRALWQLLFFVLLFATIYFSWKPSPGIAQVKWFPRLLGAWYDENDGWKNFTGFGLLALALLMAWRRPVVGRGFGKARELRLFLGFCCFVELLELGQLALPMRTCDWRDVLAGWFGGLVAWALLYVCRGVQALFSSHRFQT